MTFGHFGKQGISISLFLKSLKTCKIHFTYIQKSDVWFHSRFMSHMINFNSMAHILKEQYWLKIAKVDNFIQSDDFVNKTSHFPIIATFCLLFKYSFFCLFLCNCKIFSENLYRNTTKGLHYSFPLRKLREILQRNWNTQNLESTYILCKIQGMTSDGIVVEDWMINETPKLFRFRFQNIQPWRHYPK